MRTTSKPLRLATTLMWLLLSMALCGCPSLPTGQVPTEVPPPQLAPPPPDVMRKRERNFRERLLQIFSPSPTTPTK